ncbi:MAG: hypothetical protein ACHRXM_02700 [Isosphaerales bacterium]
MATQFSAWPASATSSPGDHSRQSWSSLAGCPTACSKSAAGAEASLTSSSFGLIPWVPLARFDGPPEPIFRACRDRIDRDAAPEEHENLLVVTHFLAGLKYNDPQLFQLLGGRTTMIKSGSPVLQEIITESKREAVIESLMTLLLARFATEAQGMKTGLEAIEDKVRLNELIKLAATCPDLESFRKQLAPRRRRRGTAGKDDVRP